MFVGILDLENHESDNAYGEADVRLLSTVAASMGVALENARLFDETQRLLKEAEQRNAELAVINSVQQGITGSLDFQGIVDLVGDKLREIFATGDISIRWYDATNDRILYLYEFEHGVRLHAEPRPPSKSRMWQRLLHTRKPVVRGTRAELETMGLGTMPGTDTSASALGVPIQSGERMLGIIVLNDHVREHAYGDSDVRLLSTIAASMGVALENARLFDETQRLLKETEQRSSETNEALEQQRATAEVLSVISSSVVDTTPVFDRILASCGNLFGGLHMGINLVGEDGQIQLGAYAGPNRKGFETIYPLPLTHESGSGAAILERRTMHYPDVDSGVDVPPHVRRGCQLIGMKSIIFAPMVWEERGIGAVFVGRDSALPFAEKEIALLRTFADQAVIAIQNARLFNETKEALEQQKASAEILSVISSSVADTAPVFDKILDSCKHLFGSDETAVLLADEQGILTLGAYQGKSRDAVAATFPAPMGPTPAGRAIQERRVMHFPDVANDQSVPRAVRRVAQQAGYKSMAYAPMLWNERGIGAIGASRLRGAFTPKELALLQTFADQAVIAIQNARLFSETQEALERQTATAEILASMSGATTDTQPVFDAIARNLLRLFGTEFAIVALSRSGRIEIAGIQGAPGFERLAESYPLPLDTSTHVGKTILTGRPRSSRRSSAIQKRHRRLRNSGANLDTTRRSLHRWSGTERSSASFARHVGMPSRLTTSRSLLSSPSLIRLSSRSRRCGCSTKRRRRSRGRRRRPTCCR